MEKDVEIPRGISPKWKSSSRESSFFGGENDIAVKPVEPIEIYSERDLTREIGRICSNLHPDKDWFVRVTAMQTIEGLVLGGAANYPSFCLLLKQLVAPLHTQLLDRRSSIIKQACHLLSFLSKELLGDFESYAEMFIPVLLKLVVITVYVIAESADNCIKMMLRNCKVSRILPRIVNCVKNDRSAVLRARCCEYALLILGYWADTPEILRSADLYEDLIKCSVADAVSEVRSTARACYRMFAKIWPERSTRLFLSFDTVRQKIINDEDGEKHEICASPSLNKQAIQLLQTPSHAPSLNSPACATSNALAMDKTIDFASLSQTKLWSISDSEKNYQSLLSACKEKGPPIAISVKAVNVSDKESPHISYLNNSDLGVDHLSASFSLQNSAFSHASTATLNKDIVNHGDQDSENLIPLVHSAKDSTKSPNAGQLSLDSVSASSLPCTSKSSEKSQNGGVIEFTNDIRSSKQLSHQIDGNFIPNFRRPLLKQQVNNLLLATCVNSFDDSELLLGEMASYIDAPSSLNDSLVEGLKPSSGWIMRIFAFNYVHSLLQQGPKGIQEITQSFDKIMKLFCRYLDDPHHKVAQAAFSTLLEMIPGFKKPFETYLDRTLPQVFGRLNDPKESIRQSCSKILDIVGAYYGIESLLPALVRSFDEKKSPKAKLAIIQFANSSFSKQVINDDDYSGHGFLKLWLSKLEPLFNDKNIKLKEAAVTGFLSIYSNYNPGSVLTFILSFSVEKQKVLRRALKRYTSRIEIDIVNFVHTKKDRQWPRSFYDHFDSTGTSFNETYCGAPMKGSASKDGLRKMNSMQQCSTSLSQSDCGENMQLVYHNNKAGLDSQVHRHNIPTQLMIADEKLTSDSGTSFPQLLHQVSGNDRKSSSDKHKALHQLAEVLKTSEHSAMAKCVNQILTVMLEMLDDPDSSVKDLALSLSLEMLTKQKKVMEDSIDTVIPKLIHATKDVVVKVAHQAESCLIIVLTEYDPLRCLVGIAPLLISDDETILIVSINSLIKIVTRLSQEELIAHLPAFLPSLVEAFSNQSTDVRKTALFCLVDIQTMLGEEAFLPYLDRFNSTQRQLITFYANGTSRAKTTARDAIQG
ncbi:CLIP-associated protein-like isoform X2 [Ananas comosus]|uniref:CLIP-associated protein-like isoform X2 n=1 Tax=Ananas comosus TaxID=4615 RepID=A0A6P5E9Y6_ANACO|nr:CLIP-associated protein-like isoform X2 [Ananas comosus]